MAESTGAEGIEDEFVLPRVPISAGALIFDRNGRLLILKPTYKSGWTIPGGIMEADGETPWEACQREVHEECGLDVTRGRLACMDFRPWRDSNPGGVRYLFDCGVLDDSALAGIVLQPAEVSEHRLAPVAEALTLLRAPIRRRVQAVRKRNGAARTRATLYLEDGRRVGAVRAS